jgi:hypothetical protein
MKFGATIVLMKLRFVFGLILLTWIFNMFPLQAQHSVARMWNELLLEAIRNDYARPTVHARNIFHTSVAMYDAWSTYDQTAKPFLLGNQVGSYDCTFNGISIPDDVKAAREEAISYATYRLLSHRFVNSPGGEGSLSRFDSLMQLLGYDISNTSVDYSTGSPAALGNYIAQCIREFGILDGSNENLDYTNLVYTPFNGFLTPTVPGTQGINDPNRWQPLSFDFFIDQAGFEIPGGIPEFLSPEWGKVVPFALSSNDLNIYDRNGDDYWVYHDPGPPALLQSDGSGTSAEYQWNHSLVAIWSSQLDPADSVMIDISPASIGNVESYPTTLEGLRDFYKLTDGGDPSQGHPINPHTGSPYEPQIVPRADYARVLAEFWADGPDSETPPGHWFTILNYVNDHPQLVKKFKGEGPVLDDLEWDVKAYFTLGGAVHDAAIAAWSIKGWYDYIRPISAIRYMAEKGQSTDTTLANYSPEGLPLKEGYIEMVAEGDSLAGAENEHLGKIKLFSWRGPESIPDPETYVGGVGWILAENWWPYQRPTFVTPPFAGYVSGHSTFSRAAAEVMTMFTGDAFFPGGMGEFEAKQNEFLVFEEGPSVDVILQWATYRDASDQTSLSRIWGGIHPPVDDIPGRFIGEKVGIDAFNLALQYFGEQVTSFGEENNPSEVFIYPNPVGRSKYITLELNRVSNQPLIITMSDLYGRMIMRKQISLNNNQFRLDLKDIPAGIYQLGLKAGNFIKASKLVVTK